MSDDVIAQMHDGTELHFPAGTSSSVIQNAVHNHLGIPSGPSKPLSSDEMVDISNIVSGIGSKPSLQSTMASSDIDEMMRSHNSIGAKYPLTAAYLSGFVKPVAGVAQWAGINEPADYLATVESDARKTGRRGVGVAEFGGELAGLIGGGVLTPEINAFNKMSPLTRSAVAGAGISALMPTDTKGSNDYETFLENKAKDIAEGAALGGVFGKGSQMLFSPIVGARLQQLKDMGVKHFTPAQLLSDVSLFGIDLGPGLLSAEQSLSSRPILGSIMAEGRKTSIADFNKAIANHVIEPMNNEVREKIAEALARGDKKAAKALEEQLIKVNPRAEAGHELVDDVYNKVTNAYKDISPKLELDLDKTLLNKENMPHYFNEDGSFKTELKEQAMNEYPHLFDEGDSKYILEGSNKSSLGVLNDELEKATKGLDADQTKKVTDTFNKFIVDRASQNEASFKDSLNRSFQDGLITEEEYQKAMQSGGNKLTGQQFRDAESNFGNLAWNAYKSNGDKLIANAYRDLQSALRGVMADANPTHAEKLNGIHEAFKRYLRLERAAQSAVDTKGIYSPNQLLTAVKALDRKGAGKGIAMMQDQANAGLDVLGAKVPNSGTADRLMMSAALTGTPLLAGLPVTPVLGALGAYSKLGMRGLTKLATERPKWMKNFGPTAQDLAAITSGAASNNYAKGGLLDKFKKK